MTIDDPSAGVVLRRSMVARIATVSKHGRPSINPLYFVHQGNKIWLGTPDWTLAVRNVKANPQVSVLFESERDTSDQRVLRITGRAEVRTDKQALRSYNLRAALKYLLTPAGIRNSLTHWRQVPLKRYYHAQSAERGGPSVIVITPERFEILSDPTRLPR
jgi:uncharacterized pyridoxamine 5'-phosphate oxidase family protein